MSANAESLQLRLITCIGEWDSSGGTSSERLVAACKLEASHLSHAIQRI